MMVHARNTAAWALGKPGRNGFAVRKVVWGYLMAQAEKRDDEEIRAARIFVEAAHKKRRETLWDSP